MRNDDRDVLATVAKLNNDMGAIVLSLLEGAHDDSSLQPGRLRELAAICDDLSALLDNHADKLEGNDGIVIDGDVADERPVDVRERRS
ncbi:MAG: hypothetical protein GEU97_16950 [Actinophytocola sp.]|nr:hypothetical protein [Actinophytocola sp.]